MSTSDLVKRLRRGTTHDYETGDAHNMDSLMEEAADHIEQLPALLWDAFIKHLNEVQPLKGAYDKKKGEHLRLPHQVFMGSIAAHKKIFMEAVKKERTHELFQERFRRFGRGWQHPKPEPH